jgi:hypothetical protein
MKKIVIFFLAIPILFSCADSNFNNNNPYLPNYSFVADVYIYSNSFSDLQYPGNGVFIAGYGVKVIFVFNTGTGYTAFDAS